METNCGKGYTWGFHVVGYIFRKHDQALVKLRDGVYIMCSVTALRKNQKASAFDRPDFGL